MSQPATTNQPKPRRIKKKAESGSQTDLVNQSQGDAGNQLQTQQSESGLPQPKVSNHKRDKQSVIQSSPQQEKEKKGRSPEQKTEVERLGKLEPFVSTQRNVDLEKQLDDWRSLRACARLVSTDSLGLSQALEYYTKVNVKRRADLLVIPAPVVKIRIEQPGRATDLFRLILSFLNNPLDFGTLWQLRSRTKGNLKSYQVKILIAENGHLLSLDALRELINIARDLGISLVLAGTPSLLTVLSPDSHKQRKDDYVEVHNSFLEYGEFSPLSIAGLITAVQTWEETGVGLSKSLNLWQDTEIIQLLHNATSGQVRLLYENLRKIYVWKIDHPGAQVNYKNIEGVIGKRLPAATR